MAAPSKLTTETKLKIEEIAALDGTVEEMAYYCDVSAQTIYNWFKEDTELFDKVQRLRAKPVLAVRRAINEKSIETYSNAMDYMKRRNKKEFGDNVDITTDGKELPVSIIPLNVIPGDISDEKDSSTE